MVHLGLMTHPVAKQVTPAADLEDGEIQEDAEPTVCAVKVVNITHPLDRRQSLDEVHVFKTLSGHERFPKFIAAQESKNATGEYLFIVMEYVDGCSLDHWLEQDAKPFPEVLLRRIAKQLLEGLVCMQSFGRVHRDIKPQNIVLDKHTNNIKIVDFGLSIYGTWTFLFSYIVAPLLTSTAESEDDAYVGSLPTVMCSGTPAFLAPEILYTYRYSAYSDVWALGATLLYMLVGPWYLQLGRLSDLDDHERNWQLMEETTRSLEGAMGDFIRKALTRKCEKRPLAADLLRHPWLVPDDLLDSD
ncbi:kinase-like protein [Hymenopellis radicata]|nr:kinase-like protein [Hymenopellis radicata]